MYFVPDVYMLFRHVRKADNEFLKTIEVSCIKQISIQSERLTFQQRYSSVKM